MIIIIIVACIYLFCLFTCVFCPIIILLKKISDSGHKTKKPLGLYFLLFMSGSLCTIIAYYIEVFLSGIILLPGEPTFLSSFLAAFCVAAIPEETVKYLFLFLFVWKSKRFTKYALGIVYAAFISLGFAFWENLLYVVNHGSFIDSLLVSFFRALTSIPGHFLFSVLMGYFFALALIDRNNNCNILKRENGSTIISGEEKQRIFKYLIFSWLAAVGAHGLYDFFLMFSEVKSQLRGLSIVAFLFFLLLLWKLGQYCINDMKAKDEAVVESHQKKSGFRIRY